MKGQYLYCAERQLFGAPPVCNGSARSKAILRRHSTYQAMETTDPKEMGISPQNLMLAGGNGHTRGGTRLPERDVTLF